MNSRRTFFLSTGAALASRAVARAANDKLRIAVLGINGRGKDHIQGFMKMEWWNYSTTAFMISIQKLHPLIRHCMTVGDWGQSLLYVTKLGNKAYTLVDLGHHLPNANIEQIVALLLMEGKLGGFHFNDSKYGDDDLTVGSIKPYQLFLIFNELVEGMDARGMRHATGLAWMIDASHNVKDPLEDLLQSVEAVMLSYAQALLVDRKKLADAKNNNDVVTAQEVLQNAFRTDVRPLVGEARLRAGGALNPLAVYRNEKVREHLIKERGSKTVATGL